MTEQMQAEQAKASSQTETATLGGGCFWCLEPIFEELQGVEDVVVGYAGGHVVNPTYEQVCGANTGHAEVVQVRFDPAIISYEDILRVFFATHDPTTLNRQGNDVGPQYRSIVLHHDEAQKKAAEAVIQEINQAGIWGAPIVTEVEPLDVFYMGEDYHQEYYKKNPWQGYCRVIIAPKVAKFRKQYEARLKK